MAASPRIWRGQLQSGARTPTRGHKSPCDPCPGFASPRPRREIIDSDPRRPHQGKGVWHSYVAVSAAPLNGRADQLDQGNAESENLNGTQPVLGVGRGFAGDRHHAELARGSVANLRLCPALRFSQDAALVAHSLRSTPKAKAAPTAGQRRSCYQCSRWARRALSPGRDSMDVVALRGLRGCNPQRLVMCAGMVETGRCPFIERRFTFHSAVWVCCKLPIPKVTISR